MENRKMNEAESLELIASVIRSSRRELARNSYRPFLIWGYTTLVVTLIEILLHLFAATSTTPTLRLYIWWSIPVVGGVLTYLLRDREEQTHSPLDLNIAALWAWLGFAILPMISIIMIIGGTAGYLILPLILLLMGVGAMITGAMTRLKVVQWGGVAAFVGMLLIAALALWFKKSVGSVTAVELGERIELFLIGQMIIFAASFVGAMIIPGHYMKRMFNKPEA